MNLERAISIAVEAHKGQIDKAGAPYILHPLRVMQSLETDLERIVGILHDVVVSPELGRDGSLSGLVSAQRDPAKRRVRP